MAFPALLAGLIPGALKLIGGGIKGFFGYREKKLDLAVLKETNDANLQIEWWKYLSAQSSMVVNQIIRPIVMLYFFVDFAIPHTLWRLGWADHGYEVVVIANVDVGNQEIVITNGLILAFVILFLFPLRTIEKWFRKSD